MTSRPERAGEQGGHMKGKYKMRAVVTFVVEADNRAAAHIVAVDALTAAELGGFDLANIDVSRLDLVPPFGGTIGEPEESYRCEGCGKTSRIAAHSPGCPVYAAAEFLAESADQHGI